MGGSFSFKKTLSFRENTWLLENINFIEVISTEILSFKSVTVVQQVSGSQHTMVRIWPRSGGVFTCTVLQNRMG